MADELEILSRILPGLSSKPEVILPPGDDCAAVAIGGRLILAAVDQVIGDIHYFRQSTPAEKIGAKVLKRNLSDIAACGGTPTFALLSLALGQEVTDDWIDRFYTGLETCCRKYHVALIGGDLGILPANCETEVASLTILGEVPEQRLARRDAAQPGDLICITGQLGNSLDSEHHLDFEPRIEEGLFLTSHGVKAMIDISDGLLLDLKRMAIASQLSCQLSIDTLPLRSGATREGALTDGEDYELLFSISPDCYKLLRREWYFHTELTCIGRMVAGDSGTITDLSGKLLTLGKTGYVHQRV